MAYRIRNKQVNIDLVPLPPIELLAQIFEIDTSIPEGLRWKDRPRDQFRTERGYKFFSARWPGKPAGSFSIKYFRLKLTYHEGDEWISVQLHNHRVVWALHNRRDPGNNLIDHADINSRNNNGNNLRLADGVQSSQNRRRRADNFSGVAGVSYRSDAGKWRARITVDKKVIDLGGFETIEEAMAVRKAAEITYFGRFAPTGAA